MANKRSFLTARQLGLLKLSLVFAIFLFANSAYLFFVARFVENSSSLVLPIIYQVMLILHIALGVLIVVVAAVFVSLHLPRVLNIENRIARIAGAMMMLALVSLLISGLVLLVDANNEDKFWLFRSHQVAAVLLLLFYVKHRLASRDAPSYGRIAVGFSAIVLLACVIYGIQSFETTRSLSVAESDNHVLSTESYVFEIDPFKPFHAVGDPDSDSEFFPSKSTTWNNHLLSVAMFLKADDYQQGSSQREIEEDGFVSTERIGADPCERCHQDVVEQWAGSAHRFSSFNNPFYASSVEITRDKSGFEKSQFCGGCHDPVLLFTGKMLHGIDKASIAAQAGLTCFSCHAIDIVHDLTGNGNYNIQNYVDSPYLFGEEEYGVGRTVHDYLLKAKPDAHKKQMLKPIFRESEYCLTCHKVNLDVHINDYRWLRGQNEYDAWQNSGVARNQPMTWYEPANSRGCRDCHMPPEIAVHGDVSAKNGKVRSHRFLASNTALPYIRGDKTMLKQTETYLQDNKVRVDIFAIRRPDAKDAAPVMVADRHISVLRAGERIQVDVVVRNLSVGHTFPGGTNDSNEGWIHFQASVNEDVIFSSGGLLENGYVDPGAHFYKAVLVDKAGRRINKRNALDIYTTVYANVIKPSTSDIARYQFVIPDRYTGQLLRLEARLQWRKFTREFTKFAFADKKVPDLPITVMAQDSVGLRVTKRHNSLAPQKAIAPVHWQRFNDYGIGLFLDNDTRGALQAFREVVRLKPELADGYLNQARVYIQEGELQQADALLRRASTLAANRPQIVFFWGLLLEKAGRLEEAIAAYRKSLKYYPSSRDIWIRLGRTYWLANQTEASIKAYREVLNIDPENRQAFYQLSLAYKAMAAAETDAEMRERYQFATTQMDQAFRKYKLDENAQKVTQAYRLTNPHDNRMSQDIVIHAN